MRIQIKAIVVLYFFTGAFSNGGIHERLPQHYDAENVVSEHVTMHLLGSSHRASVNGCYSATWINHLFLRDVIRRCFDTLVTVR